MSEKEIVNKWFEENMCVSFDKFIENWEEQQEFTKYLQQEITKLKGVIETYEIIIKANNINNWNELKKWLEEESKLKGSETAYLYYGRVSNKMQELENKQCHTTLE